MTNILKRIVSGTFFFLLTTFAFAPSKDLILILENPPIEPFTKLIHAIGMVETTYDTTAYNPFEEAIGFLQITPIRVQDYNERTGSDYSIKDMYSHKISETVFLYYASQLGPYSFEQIARNWNGSGKKTIQYWKQVKEHL